MKLKKINILRVILAILLLAVFISIFNFSAQDGEESGNLSRQITENITKNINSIQQLEAEEKEEVLSKIEHYIRKLAHFSIYTLVGILTMSLMNTYDIKIIKKLLSSFLIGLLYASLDEIHQSFVPDRTPAATDVLIDVCGVIVGIAIADIIYRIIKKIYNKITGKVAKVKK